MINIKGMDKAEVLKRLYECSHLQGYGFLQAVPEGTVTVEHCRELLERTTYFDYLYGRVLKVDLSGDEFDERLYDRDCGPGAAARALRPLNNGGKSSNLAIATWTGIDFEVRADDVFRCRELRIRFDTLGDVNKMIGILEQHRERYS